MSFACICRWYDVVLARPTFSDVHIAAFSCVNYFEHAQLFVVLTVRTTFVYEPYDDIFWTMFEKYFWSHCVPKYTSVYSLYWNVCNYMLNMPLAFVNIYPYMSDVFNTAAYSITIRCSVPSSKR